MLEEHGLASTASADNRGDLSRFDRQVHSLQDLVASKGLIQINDLDHPHT